MSENDIPCCACLTVKYDPEEVGGGSMRERWRCKDCGMVFVKEPNRRTNSKDEGIVPCSECKNKCQWAADGCGCPNPTTAPANNYVKIEKPEGTKEPEWKVPADEGEHIERRCGCPMCGEGDYSEDRVAYFEKVYGSCVPDLQAALARKDSDLQLEVKAMNKACRELANTKKESKLEVEAIGNLYSQAIEDKEHAETRAFELEAENKRLRIESINRG